jgi:hypothetical protein
VAVVEAEVDVEVDEAVDAAAGARHICKRYLLLNSKSVAIWPLISCVRLWVSQCYC